MRRMATASYSFEMDLLSECNRARRIFLALALLCVARNADAIAVKEEQTEQTFAVRPDATLTIKNTDGSIKIYGTDAVEIVIRATKKAYTAERLKEIAVEVRAAPDAITIETILAPAKGLFHLGDRSGTVDFVIMMPKSMRIVRLDLGCGEVLLEGLRGGNATASVGDGWLVVNNCFENLNLRLANGRLQASYDWWEATPFQATLASPEGDIRLNIPEDASARISARTVEGRVVNGLVEQRDESVAPSRALNLTLGAAPTGSFEIVSTSGDVRINKPY